MDQRKSFSRRFNKIFIDFILYNAKMQNEQLRVQFAWRNPASNLRGEITREVRHSNPR
jgi:hypothetical protein